MTTPHFDVLLPKRLRLVGQVRLGKTSQAKAGVTWESVRKDGIYVTCLALGFTYKRCNCVQCAQKHREEGVCEK